MGPAIFGWTNEVQSPAVSLVPLRVLIPDSILTEVALKEHLVEDVHQNAIGSHLHR